MSHYQKESTEGSCIQPVVEDKNRRKVIKSIVCGLTVFTVYNVLPNKWRTPIIEQVFLPAHAATSGVGVPGVIVSGIYGGSGSINLTSIDKISPPNGLIAKVGTSIGDFFVSEVRADDVLSNIDCCSSVEGETITYYVTITNWGCTVLIGPVAGVATHNDGFNNVITAEIIEKGQDSIRISVTLTESGKSHATTLGLSRSEVVCECSDIT